MKAGAPRLGVEAETAASFTRSGLFCRVGFLICEAPVPALALGVLGHCAALALVAAMPRVLVGVTGEEDDSRDCRGDRPLWSKPQAYQHRASHIVAETST